MASETKATPLPSSMASMASIAMIALGSLSGTRRSRIARARQVALGQRSAQ
jgi:hypothetical protein